VQIAAAAPESAIESPSVEVVSLPLPRRKPEALLTLTQVQQQSETQGRMARESRAERPRYYDARRQFERDLRRLMRGFY